MATRAEIAELERARRLAYELTFRAAMVIDPNLRPINDQPPPLRRLPKPDPTSRPED